MSITPLEKALTSTRKNSPLHADSFYLNFKGALSTPINSNRRAVTTGLLEVYQTLFRAGAYNLQSISAVGRNSDLAARD